MTTTHALTIDGYPIRSGYGPNDLTAEALRRAEQDLRNDQRRLAWHDRMLAYNGSAPSSALLRDQDYLTTLAGELVEAKPMADIELHPTFRRRRKPQQGNQGHVRIPHHKRQFRGAKLPEPPEAA
jgi:hypothetical protein